MRAAIPVSISVALIFAFGLAVGCGGCGKPVPSGTYRGERPIDVRPGTDPVIANQLRRVELSIAADGRTVYQEGGIPFEGQMTRDGDQLRLEVYTVANINVAKQGPEVPRQMTFDLLPDGSIRKGDVVLKIITP